jgi:tripartite motif-containing protein 71
MRFWRLITRTGFLAVLLIPVGLAPASARTASESQPLTLVWETAVTPEAMMISPSDMVVDADGNVFVSTQAEKNIKKFDRDGNFVTHWGGRGNGEGHFQTAAGIGVDGDGNVYVADFTNIRIQKFDNDGNFLLQWRTAPPAGPASVVVDAWGNVYVDSFFSRQNYIQKFDTSGNLLLEWGSGGEGDGEFAYAPEDITVDADGNIYVADRLNNRIQKFDSEGNFLAKFGGENSTEGNGLFDKPGGIAVDADGSLYVMDGLFLQKLDSEGNFITQWSTTEGGVLDRARFVFAVDSEGYIYVFAHTEMTDANGRTITPLVMKKLQQP